MELQACDLWGWSEKSWEMMVRGMMYCFLLGGGNTVLLTTWGPGGKGGSDIELVCCTYLLLRSEYFEQSHGLKLEVWGDCGMLEFRTRR